MWQPTIALDGSDEELVAGLQAGDWRRVIDYSEAIPVCRLVPKDLTVDARSGEGALSEAASQILLAAAGDDGAEADPLLVGQFHSEVFEAYDAMSRQVIDAINKCAYVAAAAGKMVALVKGDDPEPVEFTVKQAQIIFSCLKSLQGDCRVTILAPGHAPEGASWRADHSAVKSAKDRTL